MICPIRIISHVNAFVRDKKCGEYSCSRMVPPGTLQYAFVCEYQVECEKPVAQNGGETEDSATRLVYTQNVARDKKCGLLQQDMQQKEQQWKKYAGHWSFDASLTTANSSKCFMWGCVPPPASPGKPVLA